MNTTVPVGILLIFPDNLKVPCFAQCDIPVLLVVLQQLSHVSYIRTVVPQRQWMHNSFYLLYMSTVLFVTRAPQRSAVETSGVDEFDELLGDDDRIVLMYTWYTGTHTHRRNAGKM